MLQYRRDPIDLNPNLLLFLRYEGKLRIYPIRARIAYPADGIPFFSCPVLFRRPSQLRYKTFPNRLGRVPVSARRPLQAHIVAPMAHAGARCFMHHLRAFFWRVKKGEELKDIARNKLFANRGTRPEHKRVKFVSVVLVERKHQRERGPRTSVSVRKRSKAANYVHATMR